MMDSIQRDWVINGCRHFRAYHAGAKDERFWCALGHKPNAVNCVLHCSDRKRDTHIVA